MPGKTPDGRRVPSRAKSLQGHQELKLHRLLLVARPAVEDGMALDELGQLPKAGARGSGFLSEPAIIQVAEKPVQSAGGAADSFSGPR
jgi:hypothetical protein